MKIETVQQMPLRDVPRGEFVRRKLDAATTYTRGEYDRTYKRFRCDVHDIKVRCAVYVYDWSDISRDIMLKGSTLVWVGFDF